MDEIRIGSVGSGPIVRTTLGCLRGLNGVRIAAVCSRSGERAAALASEFGAERIRTSLEALLADETVNCVYLATPNSLHAGQVRQALEAGKHVLCEKPFCTRAEEAEALFDLAERKGLLLFETAATTYLPNYRLLRESLPKLGRIRLVTANYSQYSKRYDLLRQGELPNMFNPAFAGGCLMDIGFYNLLLNVAIFGLPAKAEYRPNWFSLPDGGRIDTSGVALLQYPDFLSVNVCAKDTWGENFFQIEGEDGWLCVRGGSNGLRSLSLETRDGREELNDQSDDNHWSYEFSELVRLLLAEDHAACAAHRTLTLETVRLMEGLRRDARLAFPGP